MVAKTKAAKKLLSVVIAITFSLTSTNLNYLPLDLIKLNKNNTDTLRQLAAGQPESPASGDVKEYLVMKKVEAPPEESDTISGIAFADLKSGDPEVRERAINTIKGLSPRLAEEMDSYLYSLPISGKTLFDTVKVLRVPVPACNIDNGELSAIQIRAFMKAAQKLNALIIFEVGPGALKTYADGKPHLPEYCAREALRIYKEDGYVVKWVAHLDHNQISKTKYDKDPEAAVQEAIDRGLWAVDPDVGFTSIAVDTSTLQLRGGTVKQRLKHVIKTAIPVFKTAHDKTEELGITVGFEGEVGDIGVGITTVAEALAYHKALGEYFDILAADLGTAHGYTWKDDDTLRVYEGKEITVAEANREKRKKGSGKEGYVLSRVKEIVKAFERIRINMIIAFHGFSGTPVEFARKFVGIGAGKTNINTDWQSITWKVLRHWYPELYREFFDEAYTLALKDKGKKAWITGDIEHDFEHAQNRIIYVYARKLFRKPKYWPLLERITRTLQEGNVRMRFLDVSEQEAKEHYLHAELPVTPDPEHGMTAFETIYKLTHERIFEIMGAFNLRNSADAKKVKNVNRARELRLQDWQIYALKRTAAREAAISSGIPDVLEEVFTESKLLSAMADLTKDPKKPKVTLPATLRSMLENIKASGRGNINIRYLNWLLHTDLTLSVPEINALKDSGKTLQEIDNIGIIYRELTRQMKKIIRGPVGVIDTYVSAAQVMDIADAPGELPSEEILREYSPVANAAVASALTAVSDGSARKKPGARAAEIKLAKNKVDTNGKDEFSAVFTETGDTVVIPIAEGLRDLEEEDTFRGGEIIRGSSGKIIAMLVDVVEKTNAAATGGNGAVSMAVGSYGTPELTPTQREALEAKGIEPKRYMINSAALRLAGSMTDSSYSHVLIAQVPGDKTKDFEGAGAINPNDPAEVILKRIADANGDEVSDYEVVLNARDRETKKLEQLKAMAVEYIFERIILEKRRNLVRTLLNAETFNTVKDVKRYVSPLITLRFLAECDQNFAEFKMNETDKNRLTELSATLAQDEDIMALVDEIEKLDKAGESLVINTIADGTFIHGAEAALGLRGRSGKKKILFSTSGSAEAFMNLAVAKAFRKHGAIASNNIMSPALKGQPDLNMRHDFASTQKGIEAAGLIREARDSTPGQEGDGHPNDSAEILSGDKIFTTAHITSENLDAAVAFMTDSDGFNQPGVKRNEDGTYSVVTLRIRYKDGKLYRWLETRRFRVDALGVVLLNPDPQVVSTNIGLKQVPSFRLHSPNAPVTLPERQDILAGISAAA